MGPVHERSRMLGRQNPLIRNLRGLRRDAALRREEGLFLAEGVHLAREAIASGVEIETVVVSAELTQHAEGPALLEQLTAGGVQVMETSPETLSSLQDARAPQPILTVVRMPRLDSSWLSEDAPSVVLVLAGVQDPGNLGALLRTAEAAAVGGLIQIRGGADPYHPRAVRGSMGSIFRLPLCILEETACVETLRSQQRVTIGTVPRGGEPLFDFAWPRRMALFLGGEGAGLSATLGESMDVLLTIPLANSVESLSVGAAAAALLFDRVGKRR